MKVGSKKLGKPKNKHWLHQIELTVGIVLSLVIVLSFFKPTITGFVSADTYSHKLDLMLDESSVFSISADELVEISTFKISGGVEGGAVRVYLDNGQGQRLLVYENFEKKKKGLGMVTGMVIGGDFEDGFERNNEKVLGIRKLGRRDFISVERNGADIFEGSFEEACEETCFIKMDVSPGRDYQLVILLEDGAVLTLDEVVFTVVE